jgi:hypothetical protein
MRLRRTLFFAAWLTLGLALGFYSSPTHAEEKLGEISVSDLLIEPTFNLTEPKTGSFSPGYSYLGATWRLDNMLSGTIKAGSLDLLGVPARFGPAPASTQLGVIEAYGQLESDYGRFRVGQVPISFGLEGGENEPRLLLPRSLLFQYRYIVLRDYGMTYRILNEGYFSDWAIHNGEGGPDLDNEMWFTARWGWQGGNFFRGGISATVGRTNPQSTNPTGITDPTLLATADAAAGMDVTLPAKIRIANLFLGWEFEPFSLEVEGDIGDTDQTSKLTGMRAAHADFQWNVIPGLTPLLRLDVLEPHAEIGGDMISEGTIGLAWKSHYENSVLTIAATQRVVQNVNPDIHKLMIIWRLTPVASNFRTLL